MSNFKKARNAKGISQKEIAITLGVSQPTVSEWEKGKKTPMGKNLKRLSELLECSIEFLLEVTDDPTPHGQAPRVPTPEELILNDPDIDEELKKTLVENIKMVKVYSKLKAENKKTQEELALDFANTHAFSPKTN